MTKILYPPPSYDYRIIAGWYRLLKNESECPTCKIYDVDLGAPIEYHHLDRCTKYDTISNMVYCRAPLQLVMSETLKCVPLCKDHHVDYHRHELQNDFIKEYYDFKNKKYDSAIKEFHAMAWLFAPPLMQQRYLDYLELKNEICNKQIKHPAFATIPDRPLRRTGT